MLVRRFYVVQRTVSRLFLGLTLGVGIVALSVLSDASPASAVSCSAAGSTGLTAALVATPGTINTNVVATGCDVGIFVDVNGVTIENNTVSGANNEGILAEDVTSLTINNVTVEDNNVSPNSQIPDAHAVALDGVSNATITGNTIENNSSGGIGVADNGPVDPGAPNAGPGSAVTASNNTISGNTFTGNTGGCAIIVEAWDPGGGVTGTTVQNNIVTGAVGQFGPHGPVIGQIVVADDAAGASVFGTTIEGNTIMQSFVSGITLHANAPHDVISNTSIENNTLSENNWGFANAAPSTDAIALITAPFPPPWRRRSQGRRSPATPSPIKWWPSGTRAPPEPLSGPTPSPCPPGGRLSSTCRRSEAGTGSAAPTGVSLPSVTPRTTGRFPVSVSTPSSRSSLSPPVETGVDTGKWAPMAGCSVSATPITTGRSRPWVCTCTISWA